MKNQAQRSLHAMNTCLLNISHKIFIRKQAYKDLIAEYKTELKNAPTESDDKEVKTKDYCMQHSQANGHNF